MFNLKPKAELSESEVQIGLKMVIWEGLSAEVMTSFTEGAFLIAMALLFRQPDNLTISAQWTSPESTS